MIAFEIPPWIAARQVRAQFVDLTPEALDRALRHYGAAKAPAGSDAAPEIPKSAPVPQEGQKSTLPAYLARFGRDRQTSGKGARLTPSQDPQRTLF